MDPDSTLGEILAEFMSEFPSLDTWERARATDWGKIEEELNKLEMIPCSTTIKYKKPPKSLVEEYKFKDNFTHLAQTLPPQNKTSKYTHQKIIQNEKNQNKNKNTKRSCEIKRNEKRKRSDHYTHTNKACPKVVDGAYCQTQDLYEVNTVSEDVELCEGINKAHLNNFKFHQSSKPDKSVSVHKGYKLN